MSASNFMSLIPLSWFFIQSLCVVDSFFGILMIIILFAINLVPNLYIKRMKSRSCLKHLKECKKKLNNMEIYSLKMGWFYCHNLSEKIGFTLCLGVFYVFQTSPNFALYVLQFFIIVFTYLLFVVFQNH